MKNFILSMLLIVSTVTFATAQSKQKSAPKKATAATTATADASKTSAAAPATATAAKPAATAHHLKSDGTPDKRFKENKGHGPVKKDGTPDMRYKANKPKKS